MPSAFSLARQRATAASSSDPARCRGRPCVRARRSAARAAPAAAASRMKMSYCSKRCSKAISMESRKPSVAISAVLAPLRSMMALVASVVPWTKTSRSDEADAGILQDRAVRRSSTASSGALRRGQQLRGEPTVAHLPDTMSVKVPPMSVARRVMTFWAMREIRSDPRCWTWAAACGPRPRSCGLSRTKPWVRRLPTTRDTTFMCALHDVNISSTIRR